MPNWVKNIVRFNCDEEQMNRIKNAITDEKEDIDFNKIVPMPGSLNLTSGSITDKALDCYRNGDVNSYQLMEKYKIGHETFDAYYELGKIYDFNIREYGFPTWYEWCTSNWGTKWNASETYWYSDDIVTFETAWSCPIQVFEKLSERFPDISFEVAFADDDIGSNCGMLIYEGGEGSETSSFNEDEAVDFAQSIWEGEFMFEGE